MIILLLSLVLLAGCSSGPAKPNPTITGVIVSVTPISNNDSSRSPVLIRFEDNRTINLNFYQYIVVQFEYGKNQTIEYDGWGDIVKITPTPEAR